MNDIINSPVIGLKGSAALFALFCLAHVVRMIAGDDVIVSGHAVPNLGSIVPAVVGVLLAAWMWFLASQITKHGDHHA